MVEDYHEGQSWPEVPGSYEKVAGLTLMRLIISVNYSRVRKE
jgi:hypothetical protein